MTQAETNEALRREAQSHLDEVNSRLTFATDPADIEHLTLMRNQLNAQVAYQGR